ncbi:NACHT domain-containing protein [Massilia norwichensis]|uniref:NACHT domain-containing protein n=1 Tax=Massilia norwichensis TaxID=1442366 RepID=A0ABT2A7K7_9BURK|nr:NACHT domain-containing protein [Massilia norwichensis]MCS0590198.1 NACHT domain-containing protein [Massilia norwichensis]
MTKKNEKQIITRNQLVLSKFQEMSEADFTTEILIPLFEVQGYKVDYHGGPSEGGKDFICRKGGVFGFEETCVVQVKKTKPSAAVGKTNSFAAIVSQLQQAAEKKVPSLSGDEQLPNNIYFITPYEIDVRALASRFEAVASLAPRGVRVLDGRAVVEYLIALRPDLVEKICGEAFVLKQKLLSNISNADLLSALEYVGEKRVTDFYCDLDFGVGKVTTKALLAMEFSPAIVSHSVSPGKWTAFKSLVESVQELFCIDVLVPPVVNIEENFADKYGRWLSPSNQEVIKKIDLLSKEIVEELFAFVSGSAQIVLDTLYEDLSQDLSMSFSDLKVDSRLSAQEVNRLNRLKRSNEKIDATLVSLKTCESLSLSEYGRIGEILESCRDHLQDIRNEVSILKITARSPLTELLKRLNKLGKNYSQLDILLKKKVNEPDYEMQVLGPSIAKAISEKRIWLSKGIANLSKVNSPAQVRDFFLACQRLFGVIERTLANKDLSDALGAKVRKDVPLSDLTERISMPLRKVFATGIHCAIFGEAGAGKTTTLHQYADYTAKNECEDELTLFLPLTRILTEQASYSDEKTTAVQKLESSLGIYLASGRSYCSADVIDFIKGKRRVTFIFDGVDEVIKRTPWIVEAISGLEVIYKNCQIIISSRASGSYVNNIKYLAVTLLPFTDEQVSHFIDGWFVNDSELGGLVKAHISRTPALREIVRSPLLSTILCVLAEHNVPLPSSEPDMYKERLELLLGRYDMHKKTKRVESRQAVLETTARKLAFYLHSRTTRAASPAILQEVATRMCSKGPSSSEARRIRVAVKELDDPCNILVPMTGDGDFGFGHLRHQEYLCARELCANRGIDLAPLLSSPWWKGVLELFARMTDDVSYVISEIVTKDYSNVTRYKDNLLAMIATRSRDERRHLSALIKEHCRLDDGDDFALYYEN